MRSVSLDEAEEPSTEARDFEGFFRRHHARLFGTLCLVTADGAEAEDLTQEAFLRMWERWDRLAEHPDLPGYLYRTAFNLHRSRLRRVTRALRRTVAGPPPSDPLSEAEDRHVLFAALRDLTRRQRAAVVLTELLGLSSEEAGRQLGIRAVTVRVLASQARSALRQTMEVGDG
jgi:RNA polymerase sigma-70 factor (ECF subfamily)